MNHVGTTRRVGYTICTKGHGRGGHFYSLRDTIHGLGENVDPLLIEVGPCSSPVLSGLVRAPIRRFTAESKFRTYVDEVVRAALEWDLELVHSFDFESHYFARKIARLIGIPHVHTKCGGPNPTRFYPHSDTLISYSRENMRYFSASRKHRAARLYWIPNRVLTPKQDDEAIAQLRLMLPVCKLRVVRISRIGPYYRRSLSQSAHLVRQLRLDGIDARLLVIGVVQDEGVAEEIIATSEGAADLITDHKFTIDASRVLGLADLVVGTGRGFMEAALLGKTLLAPVRDGLLPMLVNEENVAHFLDTNFSERTSVPSHVDSDTYPSVLRRCKKILENGCVPADLAEYADRYFDIKSASADISSIYAEASGPGTRNRIDEWQHRYLVWKAFRVAQAGASKAGAEK